MAAIGNIEKLLDDLAVKILVIEPGDLSSVGDLLGLLEQLNSEEGIGSFDGLPQMATTLQATVEKMIMGEFSDSSETYDHFGQAVSSMQEIMRDGKAGPDAIQSFCENMKKVGCEIDAVDLFGFEEEQHAGESEMEIDTRFLRDKELLECFLEEAEEHLGSIESNILALEKTPDDTESINTIFRAFHTIKGTSGSVYLAEIADLAHATENLLDDVRNGRHPMDAEVSEVILQVSDFLQAMVHNVRDVYENGLDQYQHHDIADQIERVKVVQLGEKAKLAPEVEVAEEESVAPAKEEKEPALQSVEETKSQEEVAEAKSEAPPQAESLDFLQDLDLLSGFISEAFEHLETIEVNVLDLEQNPGDEEIINNIFRPFHTVKGVSGFLNLKTINTLAHSTENLLDDVRSGRLAMNNDIVDLVLSVGDQLRTMIQNLSDVIEKGPDVFKQFDISEFLARTLAIRSGESETPPVEEPVLPDKEVAPQEEESSQPIESTPEEAAPKTVSPTKRSPAPASAERPKKRQVEGTIKVNVGKLDGLVNAVGELVIMQAMVRHNPLITSISDPKLNKDFSQLGRITTELQKTAMSMRMVPIRQTFQKMTRLVRDLSKKTGKLVDLVLEGEETEIDRNMVDSIYDPLVHMMRNSVDHGVQTPAEREKAGKPPTGTVKISAYQKGGNIVIEIQDDGQGVNTEKIREKALERGLIHEKDTLSAHEINNLIFLPGFSTADQITDVSGRGVGMDVVKKGVEKLRGKVELNSIPGEGSQFLIRLPLTLAIIDGIIVRVGSERYIIPTIAIHESMRPLPEQYNTVQGKGEALLIRDSLIPIIRLYQVFDVETECTDICDSIIVVIENEGRLRALMVDELLGKQEVVIKSLGGYMTDVAGVAGGTILGDGRVGLILDLAGVITICEKSGTTIPEIVEKEPDLQTPESEDFPVEKKDPASNSHLNS
jgi:two-component system, chemotaxis family, sensor kinase CheA